MLMANGCEKEEEKRIATELVSPFAARYNNLSHSIISRYRSEGKRDVGEKGRAPF
jgi:hypothetical protein